MTLQEAEEYQRLTNNMVVSSPEGSFLSSIAIALWELVLILKRDEERRAK